MARKYGKHGNSVGAQEQCHFHTEREGEEHG